MLKTCLCVSGVLCLLGLGVYLLCYEETVSGKVMCLSAETVVQIEEFRWVEHEDWEDEVPKKAIVLRKWIEQKSKVSVGDIDVPIFDTMCRYKIEEWVRVAPEGFTTLRGERDDFVEPLVRSLYAKRREACRKTEFCVSVNNGKTSKRLVVDRVLWGRLVIGEMLESRLNVLGKVIEVKRAEGS